jgi:hypothetical protein
MNLVVDDAVEVKMATKDTEESRRELGTTLCCCYLENCANEGCRPNLVEGRQRITDPEFV